MDLDDKYYPERNPRLAEMLRDVDFDYEGVEPKKLEILGEERGAFLARKGARELVVILGPNKGTTVVDHLKEVIDGLTQTALYLGPVVDNQESLALYHKFQLNMNTERTEVNSETDPAKRFPDDYVNRQPVGFEFTTMAPGQSGRWHGFHNPYKDVPVALLIYSE